MYILFLDLPTYSLIEFFQTAYPKEEETEELPPPLPLLRAESLPYYLDKIEEYNEPQELIEQLAKDHNEYTKKIESEMEEMRKKLAEYEEKKKLNDEIHQLEEKVKTLQASEKKASQPVKVQRTISIPITTPRPVNPIGPKVPLKTQKK
jgi:phenylalanyl-tRNA synthetase alpha subunit